MGERLVPLKPKISGALKTQLSNVALHKHSVVRTIYFEFHAVAALYLKGGVIAGSGMGMMHPISLVMVVARNSGTPGYHLGRNGQLR